MERWLIVSKYYGYKIGGAELSLSNWLTYNGLSNVWYLELSDPYPYVADKMASIERPISYELNYRFKRFQFLEWYLNYRTWCSIVDQAIIENDITHVYAYGIYGNVEVKSSQSVKILYSIRDEVGLGELKNYHRGWNKLYYAAYQFLNLHSRLIWKRRLRRNFVNCEVVTNSNYMANLLSRSKLLSPKKLSIDLPIVNPVHTNNNTINNYDVVCIGNSVYKGIDIVKHLAEEYSDLNFYVFDKSISVENRFGNVIYLPSKPIEDILSSTRVLIVPSQWKEAYGRILREGLHFRDLIIICSQQDGLKEGLNQDSLDRINWVEDYKSYYSWIKILKECVELAES